MPYEFQLECLPFGRKLAQGELDAVSDEEHAQVLSRLGRVRANWVKLWPTVSDAFGFVLEDSETERSVAEIMAMPGSFFTVGVLEAGKYSDEDWSLSLIWEESGIEWDATLVFANEECRGGTVSSHENRSSR